MYTPGYSIGSMCFKIDKYLFIGDTYIPNVKIATKVRGENRVDAENSIRKVKNIAVCSTIYLSRA